MGPGGGGRRGKRTRGANACGAGVRVRQCVRVCAACFRVCARALAWFQRLYCDPPGPAPCGPARPGPAVAGSPPPGLGGGRGWPWAGSGLDRDLRRGAGGGQTGRGARGARRGPPEERRDPPPRRGGGKEALSKRALSERSEGAGRAARGDAGRRRRRARHGELLINSRRRTGRRGPVRRCSTNHAAAIYSDETLGLN